MTLKLRSSTQIKYSLGSLVIKHDLAYMNMEAIGTKAAWMLAMGVEAAGIGPLVMTTSNIHYCKSQGQNCSMFISLFSHISCTVCQ